MTEGLKRFASVAEPQGKKFGGPSNIFSSPSAPSRRRIDFPDQALLSTLRDSYSLELTRATDVGRLRAAEKAFFAISDVRSGSVKRVAAAVGEGAQVVATLHGYLAAPAASL
jgi:hypothetical protein